MKTLIVEDNFASSLILQEILRPYGKFHTALNGAQAVDAVKRSLEAGEPYDLICLDVIMPRMDGQTALKRIRALEQSKGNMRGSKVVMTTAVDDLKDVARAYSDLCDGYLVKPIGKTKLLDELCKLGLIFQKRDRAGFVMYSGK